MKFMNPTTIFRIFLNFGGFRKRRSLISAYWSLAITMNTPGFKKLSTALLSANKGHQQQNMLGCDHWALAGSPEPQMVVFCDFIGVGIGPLPKKLADKCI